MEKTYLLANSLKSSDSAQDSISINGINAANFRLLPKSMSDNVRIMASKLNTISQPEDFRLLKQLRYIDPTHGSALFKKQLLTTGLGYSIANYSDLSKNVKSFLDNPTNHDLSISFSDIVDQIAVNFIELANAPIEIRKFKDIYSWNILPADEIFVTPFKRNDGTYIRGLIDKYYQINNSGKSIEFIPIVRNMKSNISYVYPIRDTKIADPYYGTPTYLQIVKPILILDLISSYDMAFFDNNAMPDLFIVITGGNLDSASKKVIETKSSELKGATNAHKTATLASNNRNAKIEVIPISKDSIDVFTKKYESYVHYIASAHNLSPKVLNLTTRTTGGGSEFIGALKLDLETMIRPYQYTIERQISRALYMTFKEDVQLRLKRLDISNDKDMAVVHNLYVKSGAMSIGEVRNSIATRNLGVINPNILPNNSNINDNSINESGDIKSNAESSGSNIMDLDVNKK